VKAGLEEAPAEAIEAWRILRGIPRMGPDFDQTCLPSEAGLEVLIDPTKGCFLGQESVARVRNLGHPPTLLIHVRCEGPLDVAEPVYSGAERAGRVTSAASDGARTYGLVRIGWRHVADPLVLADGRPLVRVAKVA
jgi:folate-binding protein YgfZ